MKSVFLAITALALTVQPASAAQPASDADRVIQALIDQQFSTQSLCVRTQIRRVTLSDERFNDALVQGQEGILLPRRSPAQISADRREHYAQHWNRANPSGYDDNGTLESLDPVEATQLATALETLTLKPDGSLSTKAVQPEAIRPPLKRFDGQENCTVLSFTAPEVEGELAFVGAGIDCHEKSRCSRYLLFALRREGIGWRAIAFRIDWWRD